MTFDEVLRLLKEVGFPVAVAAFVLLRLDKQVSRIAREMRRLRRTLTSGPPRRRNDPPELSYYHERRPGPGHQG